MTRVYSFDFLRVIATILIVFHHYQQIIGLYFDKGINFCWGRYNVGLVVEFFFLLSGFLIARYIEKIQQGMGFLNFFLKKYFRLLPMMAITAVVYEMLIILFECVGASYLKWYVSTEVNIWGCILTALGVHCGGFFMVDTINSPTWYLSVLILCYVIFYCLIKLSNVIKIKPVFLFGVMVFLGVIVKFSNINIPWLNFYTSRGYYSFFYGVMMGLCWGKRDSKSKEAIVGLVISGIVMVLGSSSMFKPFIEYWMTFVIYPTILIIFNLSGVKKLFCCRIWKHLGDISYNVYVWHVNVLLALYCFISVVIVRFSIYSLYGMLLYTFICFVVGAISYLLLERPIAKIMRK